MCSSFCLSFYESISFHEKLSASNNTQQTPRLYDSQLADQLRLTFTLTSTGWQREISYMFIVDFTEPARAMHVSSVTSDGCSSVNRCAASGNVQLRRSNAPPRHVKTITSQSGCWQYVVIIYIHNRVVGGMIIDHQLGRTRG